MKMKTSRILKYATAAAFRTLGTHSGPSSSSVLAFAPLTPLALQQHRHFHSSNGIPPAPTFSLSSAPRNGIGHSFNSIPTRHFFSRKNSNEEEDGSILSKAKSKLKSILPFSNNKTEKDKSQLAKQKAKSDLSNGINDMLKDAPLGLRLMGKMVAPILGAAVGELAQAVQEQSRQLDDLLDEARTRILSDSDAVYELGGEPIVVDRPFSQSSSTVSVNGKSRSSLQARFAVRGRGGSGVASMEASGEGGIERLVLDVNGRSLRIESSFRSVAGGTRSSVSSSSSRGSASSSSTGLGKNRNIDKDDIIDVEFVEKVKK